MREEIEPVVLEPKKEQFKASEPRDPQIYGPRPPLDNHALLLLRQLQQASLKRLMNNYDKALGDRNKL